MTGIMVGISEFTNIVLILFMYVYFDIAGLGFSGYAVLLGGTVAGTFIICVIIGILFKIFDNFRKIKSKYNDDLCRHFYYFERGSLEWEKKHYFLI